MTETVPQRPWSYAIIKEVAAVLADTSEGLTGKEIGDLLARLRMPDPLPEVTKRDRLTEAFVARQNIDGTPKRIITFIVRPELHTFSARPPGKFKCGP